jgi:polyisoprenyl-teichoic acid--peptidoglycan teichoic acid transferase
MSNKANVDTENIIENNQVVENENIQNSKNYKIKPKSAKGKIISIIIILILFFATSFAVLYSYRIVSLTNNTFANIFPNQNLFGLVKNFLGFDLKNLKGQSQGRTNFLLIGKDYGFNTDTLIVLSYYHKTKEFASISLPRDLRVNDGFGAKKINSVYAGAVSRDGDKNKAEEFLTNFLSQSLGIEMHYWAKVDIEGLTKVIDILGGIDINIENTFSDCEFPTPNYQLVYYPDLKQRLAYIRPCPKFVAGFERVNSERALIYARSRKSFDNPAEAIDFARNQRQQKVIEAILSEFKKQATNGSLIFDTNKLEELSKTLGNNISTSLEGDEFASFLKIISGIENIKINRFELDYNSNIICQSNDDSSDVVMCDGNRPMTINSPSRSQLRLRETIKNLKNASQVSKLYNSSIYIAGNGSDVIAKTVIAFKNSGFNEQNMSVNYSFNKIKRATKNTVEKAYIYIQDNDLKTLFENSNFDFKSLDTEFISSIPNEYTLPQNVDNRDIIVLIY